MEGITIQQEQTSSNSLLPFPSDPPSYQQTETETRPGISESRPYTLGHIQQRESYVRTPLVELIPENTDPSGEPSDQRLSPSRPWTYEDHQGYWSRCHADCDFCLGRDVIVPKCGFCRARVNSYHRDNSTADFVAGAQQTGLDERRLLASNTPASSSSTIDGDISSVDGGVFLETIFLGTSELLEGSEPLTPPPHGRLGRSVHGAIGQARSRTRVDSHRRGDENTASFIAAVQVLAWWRSLTPASSLSTIEEDISPGDGVFLRSLTPISSPSTIEEDISPEDGGVFLGTSELLENSEPLGPPLRGRLGRSVHGAIGQKRRRKRRRRS
jgi:hypothetical protein